jgi:hypothetical protein
MTAQVELRQPDDQVMAVEVVVKRHSRTVRAPIDSGCPERIFADASRQR